MFNVSVTPIQECEVKNLLQELTLSFHIGLSKENLFQGWQIPLFLCLTYKVAAEPGTEYQAPVFDLACPPLGDDVLL